MSRYQASAVHLGISFLVIATLAALLSATWYPPTYAWAMGGLGLIAILAGVDVCLGPLLTLIVWNVKKPSLKLDMAVIVLIQMLGLSYGLYAILLARPVYLVFATDRFDLVTASDIPEGETEKAIREEFKSLPLTGPMIVAAQSPTESAERNRLLFSALAGGADLPQLPRYYVPYNELATVAARKAQPLDALMQRDAATRDQLSAYLARRKFDPAKVKYLPMRAKAHDQSVIVDAATAEVLDIVNVDPWEK